MPGEIKTQARFLVGEALAVAPIAHDGKRGTARGTLTCVFAEQRDLGRGAFRALGVVDRRTDRRDQACATRVDRIERAGADQRFDRPAIDGALVDAATEFEKIAERPAGGAR